MGKDFCLASQEIRARIKEGRIKTPFDELRIQPSSFEPIIGDEIYVLDTEAGAFQPDENQTVYGTLLQLPEKRRQKVDIGGGFELKKGFTYLVPLEDRIILSPGEYVKSSPKSSLGRVFVNYHGLKPVAFNCS
jgi:deoxycytidine triphosphate deaminase